MPAPHRKRQPTAKGKEAIEQANSTARKRSSSTLDSGDDVQVAATPTASRLRLHGPKDDTPKHTPLKLNGPKPTPKSLKLHGPRDDLHERMLAGLDETQSTNSSMPPPPSPPETTYTDSLTRARMMDMPPPRAPVDFPLPKKGLFRKLILAKKATEALDRLGTPTPSRVYDISAGASQASGTQDYYTGTQQDRVSMGGSQASLFSQPDEEDEEDKEDEEDEDDDATITAIIKRSRPRADDEADEADEADNDDLRASTALSQQSKATAKTAKTATKGKTTADGRKDGRKATEGRKKAESQPPPPVDIKYRLFRRCYYEGKECGGNRRLDPVIKGDRGSNIVLEDLISDEHALAIQAANELGLACHRVSIRAVPTHTKMSQKDRQDNEVDVQETQPFWDHLEDDIREFHRLKRTDLTIHLTSKWGRRSDGTILPPTPTPAATPSQSDASLPPSRPRNTATTKLQAEREQWQSRQNPAQETHMELLAKWRCLKTGCNDGFHCYVDGKQEHFPITPQQSLLWAKEIHKEGSGVTKEQPSTTLFGALRMDKRTKAQAAKRSRSEQVQTAPAQVIAPVAPVAPVAPGPTINYYIGRGPDDDLPRERSSTRFVSATPHRATATPQRATATPAPFPPPANPPSSPVRGEQYTLKDYIDWHIKKQPAKKEVLTRAYNKLEEECYMIHHIQAWKDTTDPAIQKLWQGMEIPLGLGRQLAENASTFARQYEQEHTRQLTIRESPHKPRKHDTWQQPAQPRDVPRPSIEEDLSSLRRDSSTEDEYANLVGDVDLDDSQAFVAKD